MGEPMRRTIRITLLVLTLGVSASGQATRLLIDESGDGQGNVLENPVSVAMDELGHVFVAGQFSDTVFRIDPDGSIHLILDSLGDGQGGAMARPTFLAANKATGTLYVSEQTGVFRVELDGTIEKIIDNSPLLSVPGDVALDSVGNLYVTGRSSRTALRIRPDNSIDVLLTASGDGQGSSTFDPVGIDVDSQGNVYVAGGEGFLVRVFRIAPDGSVDLVMDESTLGLFDGWGVEVDLLGNAYISECFNKVYRVAPNGDASVVIDQFGTGTGHWGSGPMAVDVHNNLYVPSPVPENLFQVSPDGTLTEVDTYGFDIAQETGLEGPYGIAVDSEGNIALSGLVSNTVYLVEACPSAASSTTVNVGSGANPQGFVELAPPVLGRKWMTSVDLAASGAPFSLLVISLQSTPMPMPTNFGELLCQPPFVLSELKTGVHEVVIPNQCALQGRQLASQAAAVFGTPFSLELQNGLEFTIGDV